ncbi:MAG: hypothetical protein ACFB51_19370, partial [Anaerolineae bacterium]
MTGPRSTLAFLIAHLLLNGLLVAAASVLGNPLILFIGIFPSMLAAFLFEGRFYLVLAVIGGLIAVIAPLVDQDIYTAPDFE